MDYFAEAFNNMVTDDKQKELLLRKVIAELNERVVNLSNENAELKAAASPAIPVAEIIAPPINGRASRRAN